MNYRELVVSKTPSVYVPYDDGTNNDVIGTFGVIDTYLSGANPVYDYRAKAHGMRSKRTADINATGNDYKRFSTNHLDNVYYAHVECWMYLPVATYTSSVTFADSGTRPTSNWQQFSYYRINTAQKVVFVSQTRGGTQDHTMTSIGSVPLGQWFHVAVQFEPNIKRIFINGVLDSEVTGTFSSVTGGFAEAPGGVQTTYIDEWAVWHSITTTRPANFPTAADILQRATFPRTKTLVWSAANNFWITSGDEQYWNGTQWISMQDLPYKVWNGTEWVTV